MRNSWAEGPAAVFCAAALCCFKSDCYTENPVGLCTLLATAGVATSCDTAVQAARDAGVGRDNCQAKNERRIKIVFGAFDLCLGLVRPRRSNEMDGLLRLIIGDANHCSTGPASAEAGRGRCLSAGRTSTAEAYYDLAVLGAARGVGDARFNSPIGLRGAHAATGSDLCAGDCQPVLPLVPRRRPARVFEP